MSKLLDYTRKTLFTGKTRARKKAAKLVFMISDGWSQDRHLSSASIRLRHRRVKLFILVIGSQHKRKIEVIASKPTSKHVLLLRTYRDLAALGATLKDQGN